MRFDDPFEIIAHLMVGSEGTLAFLAGVTMRTEREYEHKASAMVYFSDIGEACRAVVEMRKLRTPPGSASSTAPRCSTASRWPRSATRWAKD